MSLTLQDVEHIAELARLGLTDEEKELYRTQLSSILDYAARLQSIDTANTTATASVVPLHNIWRADEVVPCLTVADVLANAPAAEDDYFRVHAVLEES